MIDKNLIILSQMRKTLRDLMKPEILNKFVEFLEATGKDNSMLERYEWFCKNSENGSDCRYAEMAKNFFIKDQAKKTAETINWLYHNWSKQYEKK